MLWVKKMSPGGHAAGASIAGLAGRGSPFLWTRLWAGDVLARSRRETSDASWRKTMAHLLSWSEDSMARVVSGGDGRRGRGPVRGTARGSYGPYNFSPNVFVRNTA